MADSLIAAAAAAAAVAAARSCKSKLHGLPMFALQVIVMWLLLPKLPQECIMFKATTAFFALSSSPRMSCACAERACL